MGFGVFKVRSFELGVSQFHVLGFGFGVWRFGVLWGLLFVVRGFAIRVYRCGVGVSGFSRFSVLIRVSRFRVRGYTVLGFGFNVSRFGIFRFNVSRFGVSRFGICGFAVLGSGFGISG